MANEIRKYVPLVQNKGEINYQQNYMDHHKYHITDNKIVIEFISCNRNSKQKLLNGYYTGTDGKQNYNSRVIVPDCRKSL